MNILLIEPFFTGSHAAWARGFQKNSRHHVKLLTMKGAFWKWRMHGGAITLAEQATTMDFQPELILATDMLDVTTFLSLTRQGYAQAKTAVYFHENQLSYPWSPGDEDPTRKWDRHYAFINYTSALTADRVFYNSDFHRQDFLQRLPDFLKVWPDHKNLDTVTKIAEKSQTLPLGLDLNKFDRGEEVARTGSPLVLWNHRWEYDKNPEAFFRALFQLKDEGEEFRVAIVGEKFAKVPAIFTEAKERLADCITDYGYLDSFAEYATILKQADILPVTSNQDFFGISLIEAIYCNCWPLIPNRLAFPEHLPVTLHKQFLYEEDCELVPRIRELFHNIEHVRASSLKIHVEKYDWSRIIRRYDNLMEEIADE